MHQSNPETFLWDLVATNPNRLWRQNWFRFWTNSFWNTMRSMIGNVRSSIFNGIWLRDSPSTKRRRNGRKAHERNLAIHRLLQLKNANYVEKTNYCYVFLPLNNIFRYSFLSKEWAIWMTVSMTHKNPQVQWIHVPIYSRFEWSLLFLMNRKSFVCPYPQVWGV